MKDQPIGLTSAEAARLLAQVGPNEPAPRRRFSAVTQLARLFANPLVIILLVASAISGSLGQRVDAMIIVTIVVLSVTINFWQSYRSEQAAERLRASVAPTATAFRDGRWQEVPLRTVVPGDAFRLSAGDLVPADGRLLESRDLSVQQSTLTGESLPADKHAAAADHAGEAGPDAPYLVFLGTSVVSGTGTAIASATGPRTMFGDVAARLGKRAPESEFEHGLRRFSLLILRTTVALVLFILMVGIALKHDPFESLLFAVALGVGLTPEFLPMIASITLSRGALRMAREGVIVKQLPAIQNFGSIDIFCCDKTGTLTAGTMQLDRVFDPEGADSPRPWILAYLNSYFETGIRSPLDVAILRHHSAETDGYRKVDEIPFDFDRRRLSVVVEPPAAGGRHLLITKGSPEGLFACVTAVEVAGSVKPLDANTKAACSVLTQRLSADGLRVLAVAYRWLEPRSAYARADEVELVLAGFISFADPVLPDVAKVLEELKQDGVTVKILTGDNDLVAGHVCRTIGLDHQRMVTGEELARLDDAALGHVAEQTAVFTRVSP
ncbi:MAG: HAD-IC family P-type ATPase, partial [Vicinamibacterales bacterium]